MRDTLDGVDTMTARRTGVIAPNEGGPRLSVGISSRRHSRPDTTRRQTCQNTSGETNLGLRLKDYWLAYQVSGAVSDDFFIRHLPLFLADSAQTWLEHLPANCV